jgi:hypothetical protein
MRENQSKVESLSSRATRDFLEILVLALQAKDAIDIGFGTNPGRQWAPPSPRPRLSLFSPSPCKLGTIMWRGWLVWHGAEFC